MLARDGAVFRFGSCQGGRSFVDNCCYFLPFAAGGGDWLKRSCLDFAAAAFPVLSICFCFWSRCFDFGDLSPMQASIPWLAPFRQ